MVASSLPYNLSFENVPQVLRSMIARCQSKEAVESLQFYDNDQQNHSPHRWEDVVKSAYAISSFFTKKGSALKYKPNFDSSVDFVRVDEMQSIQAGSKDENMKRWGPKDYRDLGSPDLYLMSLVFNTFRTGLNIKDPDESVLDSHCKVMQEYFEVSDRLGGLSSIKIGYKSQKDGNYYGAFDSDDYFAHAGRPESANGSTVVGMKVSVSDVVGPDEMLQLVSSMGVAIIRYLNSHGYVSDVPGAIECLRKISK